MTTVIKVNRRNPNYTLYIGRAWAGLPASKWSNPFHLYNYGNDRAYVLKLYEQHVRSTPELWNSLHEIDDQVLGCWCHEITSDGSVLRCHGDVLIKLRKEQLAAIQTNGDIKEESREA